MAESLFFPQIYKLHMQANGTVQPDVIKSNMANLGDLEVFDAAYQPHGIYIIKTY